MGSSASVRQRVENDALLCSHTHGGDGEVMMTHTSAHTHTQQPSRPHIERAEGHVNMVTGDFVFRGSPETYKYRPETRSRGNRNSHTYKHRQGNMGTENSMCTLILSNANLAFTSLPSYKHVPIKTLNYTPNTRLQF